MNIDVIYPVHNRLYYTSITFPRVLHECINTGSKLWIYDDDSTDGSSEFITDLLAKSGFTNFVYRKEVIGNSTFCINETLTNGENYWLYKVDNDILIPDGSFLYMTQNMPSGAGFMMMKEARGFPYIGSGVREKTGHIGGVGLFRREAFENKLITMNGRFFGFTHFQNISRWGKYIIDSGNTNLDLCEWWSRVDEYEQKGWGRKLHQVKTIWH